MRVLLLACVAGCAASDVDVRDRSEWRGWPDDEIARRVPLRIAHWNIEELAAPGSAKFNAQLSILLRLDADVVLLNEIPASQLAELDALADAGAYAHVFAPEDRPFGSLGNAVLSRLPFDDAYSPSSAALAGDDQANDQTRLPVVVTFTVPDLGVSVGLVGQHLKSGFAEADPFRRGVEGRRMAQAADALSVDLVVAGADFNAEPGEAYEPPSYTALPDGLPPAFRLGSDLSAALAAGIGADPMLPLTDAELIRVDARLRNGLRYTRPDTGRYIDHFFVSAAVAEEGYRAEIYDSKDEFIPGIADGPGVPARDAVDRASDHLPLLLELRLPEP